MKRVVSQNRETLEQLRKNFKNPNSMQNLLQKLNGTNDFLSRLNLIGCIYQFREILLDAQDDVLFEKIPFVVNPIKEFLDHLDKNQTVADFRNFVEINELATSCGVGQQRIRSNSTINSTGLDENFGLDPILLRELKFYQMNSNKSPADLKTDSRISTLFMVFIAVALPEIAKQTPKEHGAVFHPQHFALLNNGHCISQAVNHILPALICTSSEVENCTGGQLTDKIKTQFNEFLALSSLSLLQLGQIEDKMLTKNRESVYLLLEKIMNDSPYMSAGDFEVCFPYVLLRNAFQCVRKVS